MPEVAAIWGKVGLDVSGLETGMRQLKSTLQDADNRLKNLGQTGGNVDRASSVWFRQFSATMAGVVAANLLGKVASSLLTVATRGGEADARLQSLGRTGEGVNKSSGSWFSSFTATLSAFVVNNILGRIASGIQGIAAQALASTASLQTMRLTLESLLAREIAKGKATTVSRQAVIGLTEEERGKLGELRLEYDLQAAQVQEATERLRQLTAQWGADGLTVKTHAAQLEIQKGELAETGAKIDALAAKETQLTTIEETVYTGTMSIKDALEAAREPAAKLMEQLATLAIKSPYTYETVLQTWKQAKMYGFTADESTTLTQALLDVAAGSGLTNEQLDRSAYNLMQIRMQGKVTAMDIRQLANAGFDLEEVLGYVGEKMGVQVKDHEDFNKALETGKIKWADFVTFFDDYAKTQFGDASDRISKTLEGLKSTISDVFKLTLPKVLGPAVEEVTETLGKALGILLKIRETGVLDELGKKLGEKLGLALGPINELIGRMEAYLGILGARKKALAEREKAALPIEGLPPMPEIMLPEVPEVPEGGFIQYVFGEKAMDFLRGIGERIDEIKVSLRNTKKWIDENWPAMMEDFQTFLTCVSDIASALKDMHDWLEKIWKLYTEGLGNVWNAIVGAFTNAPGAALGPGEVAPPGPKVTGPLGPPGYGQPGGPLGPPGPPPGWVPYQAGGIVTRPTLAMVGEGGPEAILPLRGRGGLTRNATIVVQSVLPPNEFALLQLARMLKPALEAA